MLAKTKLMILAGLFAFAAPTPAAAVDYDAYTQCLIDNCFGHYVGDPAGYELCRQWCWHQAGGNAAPVHSAPVDAKLN